MTLESSISVYRSLPSRERYPTPAPPNSPIFPPREYAAHPQWIQLEESHRTKHPRPTKPSRRAHTMQPQVHGHAGTEIGPSSTYMWSVILDVILAYLGAPLLGRCLCRIRATLQWSPCGLLQRVPGVSSPDGKYTQSPRKTCNLTTDQPPPTSFTRECHCLLNQVPNIEGYHVVEECSTASATNPIQW